MTSRFLHRLTGRRATAPEPDIETRAPEPDIETCAPEPKTVAAPAPDADMDSTPLLPPVRFAAGIYRAIYQRVGMHGSTHSDLPAPPSVTAYAATREALEDAILADCRRYLGSRTVDVVVDLHLMAGQIITGIGHLGGEFTLQLLSERDVAQLLTAAEAEADRHRCASRSWRSRYYTEAGVRWDDELPPGGEVCATCGQPVESEPCAEHNPRALLASLQTHGVWIGARPATVIPRTDPVPTQDGEA